MKRLFLALAATFVAVSAQAQGKSPFATLMESFSSEFCLVTYNKLKQDPSSVSPAAKARFEKECVDKKQSSNKSASATQQAAPAHGSLVLSHNEVGQVRLMCMKLRGANPPALCTDPRLEAAVQAGL